MRTKRFPKHAMLLIRWNDIVHDPTWQNEEKADKAHAVRVVTVGFFLRNKGRELHLATDVSEDGDCDVKVIPWGCVEDITELESKRGEWQRKPE